jgi:hypothetical protein
MVRSIFKIVFVKRGQEARWRGCTQPTDHRRDLPTGIAGRSIGRCELVEAHHIEDAVQSILRQYPDYVVMREGSERICGA